MQSRAPWALSGCLPVPERKLAGRGTESRVSAGGLRRHRAISDDRCSVIAKATSRAETLAATLG